MLPADDEMEQLFREQLMDAGKEGATGIGRVWQTAMGETISLVAPSCVAAFSLWSVATLLSSSLILLTLFGFCTFGNADVIYGCTKEP